MLPRLLRAALWIAVALGAAALVWVWFLSGQTRLARMMTAVPIVAATALLAAAALATVRGPSRRAARRGALALLALVASLPVLFRLHGFTGDFRPVLAWRFAPADDALPALPGIAPAPVPAVADPAPPAQGEAAGQAAVTAAPQAAGAPPAGIALPSASFPQFLGPTRTGVVAAVRLARDWHARPPRLVWTIPVGAGWSGFAIDGGLAITQEQRGGDEMVVAYDLMTGAPRWSHKDAVRYASMLAGDGPRATPTIAGRHVAAVGSTGRLTVLDARSGRRLWGRDINEDNGAITPEWGRAGSPLVLDGRVIVSAGGPEGRSLVAYDLDSGAPAWAGGSDGASYSSPIQLSLLGRPQIVVLNRASLAGHDPGTGAVLWSQPWPAEAPNVAVPVRVADDLVLGSTGYGIGSKLVKLAAGGDGRITPTLVWESPRLKAKFTNPVLHDGFVYGLDDGVLVCLDVATGERRWRAGRYGHGQTLLAGDVLLVTTEDGDVVLVEPTPERHRELTRFTAFDGKTWNPAALAGRYLLLRTDKEAKLFELAVE